MAIVISVSSINDFIIFRWDDGDSVTFSRLLIEATAVSECCEGVFLRVEVKGHPLHGFRFDSKKSANSANYVVVGKKPYWTCKSDSDNSDV
jgi:hypothetical protein